LRNKFEIKIFENDGDIILGARICIILSSFVYVQ